MGNGVCGQESSPCLLSLKLLAVFLYADPRLRMCKKFSSFHQSTTKEQLFIAYRIPVCLYSYSPSIHRHRPFEPDLSIVFLSSSQVLAR